MSTYTPKKYEYVSWTEGTGDDKATRYGQISAVTSSNITIEPYDPNDTEIANKGKTTSKAPSVFAELAKSAWARMKMRALPNTREVAENVVASSLYHVFLRKNTLFGAENVSFLLADLTHEFLTKGLAESMMDIFGPSALEKDGSDFFQMADITDSLRKLPFVLAFQQVYQNIFFKKHMSHQVMSNLFGDAGILYVSNVADRMWYADTTASPNYTYP